MRMWWWGMWISGALICLASPLVADEYYVWQRQWSEPLTDSVTSLPPSQCTVLFAELERRGKDWRWVEVSLPIRLNLQTAALRMNIFEASRGDELLQHLKTQLARLPQSVEVVELDIDVPERALNDYADWLVRVRPFLDSRQLSVTTLPVHLKHAAFRRVIDTVDSYVLQLHGIANPREVKNGHYSLMDEAVAMSAIARAKGLGRPFKIALPTYAYVLEFKDDGTFKRLYAENFPFNTLSPQMKLVQPDLSLISRIIRQHPEIPRIWFRHPAPDDRYNLDMPTIDQLLNFSTPPRRTLNLTLERKDNRLLLNACYRNHIPDTVVHVSLWWITDSSPVRPEGETFLFNGTTSTSAPQGPMPESIVISPRRCGETFPVAAFLLDSPPSLPIFTSKDPSLCLEFISPR